MLFRSVSQSRYSVDKIEIDMIDFQGPAFPYVDNRLMSLQLIKNSMEKRVDLQLAHSKKSKDSSRAPYDHTKFVESRKVIMQDWADILDSLQAGKPVEGVTKAFGPMSKRRTALLRVIERE